MLDLIDSHLHLWDSGCLDYPWLDEVPTLGSAYLPDDVDPGVHNLAGAVVVEAGADARHTVREVEWVEQLATSWPWISGLVAHAPLELGKDAEPALTTLAAHPLVAGVRRNVQDGEPGFCLTDDFVDGVKLLADHGYPMDLCVRHHQLPEVTELVARVPQVTFVLDHLGKPAVARQEFDPWREQLSRLAGHDNVVCKLSGLTTEADHHAWREDEVLPYLEHALAQFGADRVLFGSDWPVATLATTYPRWVDLVETATTTLSDDQRVDVFSGTARRVYRLPAPRTP